MSEPPAIYKPLRSTAPEHSILNPRHAYVPSVQTDIKRTFDRIRAAQQQQPTTDKEKK